MSTWSLILAGGASRRMGVNKLLLPRGHRRTGETEPPILSHVVEVANRVCDHTCVLASPRDVWDGGGLAHSAGILHDHVPFHGPLNAVASGWPVEPGVQYVFLIAADLPGLVPDVLMACQNQLMASEEAFDGVVIVREGRPQPLLGCYRARTGSTWRSVSDSGEVRLMVALERLNVAYLFTDVEGWPEWWTRPVHTPEDYQEWLLRSEV